MTATGEAAALPLNLHEYETAAREILSPMVFDFVAGDSGDEVTLLGNRVAFDRWRLLPRMPRSVGFGPVSSRCATCQRRLQSSVNLSLCRC